MKHITHITSSIENLKSILESTSLRLHYCKEDFCIGEKIVSKAVHPMVSFSEYDVSTINKENITYGKFGIGFSRNWVRKHKIHQVMYIEKNSIVAESLANLLIARRKNAETQLAPKVRLSIMTIKCFTKNACGENTHLKIPNFDFRSENEWRYVPTKKQIDGNYISLNKRTFTKDRKTEERYNNRLLPYALKFATEDIEYIFVESREQISEITKIIPIDVKKILISGWNTETNKC